MRRQPGARDRDHALHGVGLDIPWPDVAGYGLDAASICQPWCVFCKAPCIIHSDVSSGESMIHSHASARERLNMHSWVCQSASLHTRRRRLTCCFAQQTRKRRLCLQQLKEKSQQPGLAASGAQAPVTATGGLHAKQKAT